MIPRRPVMLVLAVATTLLLAAPGVGRADTSIGLHGGFSSGPDQFIIGPHLNLSPVAENLYIVPSGEVGFGDDITTLAFNGDLQYRFETSSEVRPYAGGGVALVWFDPDGPFDSETNLGVHILGGIFFGRLNGQPMFVDVKAGLTDEVPDWKFQFGINF
ncbi:MAG TPA: hypothetical protein VGJ98_03505 [Candidatus Eisenbacteria bacterium]|jgi:hypothetical protein